jgi:hypothetical protein
MKRFSNILIVTCLAISLAGCSPEWQKKFTRKKKDVKKRPKIYQERKYPKKPSPEIYKKHYSYVVTWMSELLSDLGGNHKKDVRCMEEIVSNMKDMQNVLVPEWQDKFQVHIDRIMKVREIILYEDLSKFNIDYVKSSLEREDRAIKRDFSYKRAKDHLVKTSEEEAQVTPTSVEAPVSASVVQTPPVEEAKAAENSEAKDEAKPQGAGQ